MLLVPGENPPREVDRLGRSALDVEAPWIAHELGPFAEQAQAGVELLPLADRHPEVSLQWITSTGVLTAGR